jgi:hypothetical protein
MVPVCAKAPARAKPINLYQRKTMVLTGAEILAIYNALDMDRKQQLLDVLLQLLEEQRQEPRAEQRV